MNQKDTVTLMIALTESEAEIVLRSLQNEKFFTKLRLPLTTRMSTGKEQAIQDINNIESVQRKILRKK
jgi:hypothetical protein